MLHDDLLLPSATMVVKPLSQKRYCSCGLVSKREILCMRFKVISWIASPGSLVQ